MNVGVGCASYTHTFYELRAFIARFTNGIDVPRNQL